MDNDTQKYMDILVNCAEAAQQVDTADTSWKPDNGTYTAQLIAVDVGTAQTKKNNRTYTFIRPTFQILDGEYEDRTFCDYFCIYPDTDVTKFGDTIGIAGLARLATCILGSETKDPAQNLGILQEAVKAGNCCIVLRVTRDANKNDPNNPYVRYHFDGTVDEIVECGEGVGEVVE